MSGDAADALGGGGRLVENVMHFARVLRAAGLPIGTGRVVDATRALEVAGLRRRDDVYWTLHAVFVSRPEQRDLFEQAFHIFWRNPKMLEQMLGLPPVSKPPAGDEPARQTSRRLAEALLPQALRAAQAERGPDQIELDAAFAVSDRERLQRKDFEAMSAAELAEARQAIAGIRLPIAEVATRRFRPAEQGAGVDMRRTLRAALRSGGRDIPLKRRRPVRRHPPLVVLCDISGSMSRYSRMFLHFLHAVTNDRDRVHSFLFGTRLTNVTRQLRQRDVDLALADIGELVEDWSGGTRIAASLHAFNRDWSRRVLGQGAMVLLITDGLDREGGAGLEHEMQRLHGSCRRLVWLNPLLRWDGFEPKAAGVRAMLPHVDEFRPVHSLESLRQLARALGPHAMSEPRAISPSRAA